MQDRSVEEAGLERGQVWRHKSSGQLSTVLGIDSWFGVGRRVRHKRRYRSKWTDQRLFLRDYEFTGDVDAAFGAWPLEDDA